MSSIPTGRVLEKLDEYLGRNDYAGAKRHLLYWLSEAEAIDDGRGILLLSNELMGLCRKLGEGDRAIGYAEKALLQTKKMGIENNVGAATTYLNSATVYKAFGRASDAVPLFERARAVYENNLAPDDERLGGLYNNMALACVDLQEFQKALDLYEKACSVMSQAEDGMLEVAITYLNIATLKEAELGLENAQDAIEDNLQKAAAILDEYDLRNGYYAFVCE
ncbi:MAG: tetratricopeptide repeat protein, partial [Clostridia bacterium]|nr:tetratricopeptide repeat protein [Clostridia bacterium]